ncbi:MAG TPA: mercuric reductase, partial [Verrucomicrobiae bacterium]|nr:mercuric reductase [Verrucomicrobiae bacterium]
RFRDLGVDVFLGEAHFGSRDTVEVGGAVLRFKKAVIATGARAATPPIEGLREAGFLTNETVFSLTERPRRLAVIGGGPIGCELAQTFQRLGAQVTLFHNKAHVLDREDPDAAEVLQKRFVREGVRLVVNARITNVSRGNEGRTIRYQSNGNSDTATVDEILVAAGRAPNVEGLNLETAGVHYDSRGGVEVNDRLQTTNPRIYACGDICLKWKFTHAADAAARIVIQNALFLGRKKVSSLVMPWCTYTDPEIAHVGLTERQAQEREIALDTFAQPMNEVDRSIADAETEGFAKVHVRRGTGQILGATIVARHAGEMIGELTLAMTSGISLGKIANLIHPYPTQADAIRKVADAYNRTRLTPSVKRILKAWLLWAR